MFTEYVFENRKYDVALRDVKSILFDIVMSEQEKVTAIISKVKTTGDKSLQEKLIVLCNEQGECLRNLLEISNSFSENLQMLDSYSRELKRIENKNIANIITGMRKDNSSMLKKNQVAAGVVKEQPNVEGAVQNPEVPNLLTPSPELAKMTAPGQNMPSAPQTGNNPVGKPGLMTPPDMAKPVSTAALHTTASPLDKPQAAPGADPNGLLTPPNLAKPAPAASAPAMPNPLDKPPTAPGADPNGLLTPPNLAKPAPAASTPAMPNPLDKPQAAPADAKDGAGLLTPPDLAKPTPAAEKPEEKKEEKPAAPATPSEEKKDESAEKPVDEKEIAAAKEIAKSFGLTLPDNINMASGKMTVKRDIDKKEFLGQVEAEADAPKEETKEEAKEEKKEEDKEEVKETEEEKKEETDQKEDEVKEDKEETEEKEDSPEAVVKLPMAVDNKAETENASSTIQFKKHSKDEAKAILTSSKQVGKLRESIETQEKILKDNGFLTTQETSDSEKKESTQPAGVIPQIIPKVSTDSSNEENKEEKEQMIEEGTQTKVEIPQVKAA